MASSTLGDTCYPCGLLQHLDVIGVQLLLSHAVHHGHELFDTHLTLLFRALQVSDATCVPP